MYAEDLDVEGIKEAGYPVPVPVDRGFCPRNTWELQEKCPEIAAGSNLPGGHLDASVSWADGGQRIPPGCN